ncbi:LysR family transcriptional regulator [Alkalicoccobacillus porphyridii]|uniref:LysR family transcriptional regulator n=1 Tax=Alkalicoccobacillus porphyridii TaxID=2597270 RepID=A0A554A0Z8_9BACI|nr:LysR family transcriptional regulator [Alkalicoccobacillus porphyridii]TSB47364.1 LysR family transcriptional regulator [Alkalicoccobacillus porphyridii]
MNIQWIESFLAAAKYENFRKAASSLYVSQPTVTVHIQQLEKLVGVDLFERTGRRVVLTHYGREFVSHAHSMYDAYLVGMEKMDRKIQGYLSEVKIAVSPLVATSYLPHWVKAFVRTNSRTEVKVEVMESILIGSSVEEGRSDIGISRMPHASVGVTCREIQTEKLFFVVPHDGRDAETGGYVDYEKVFKEHVLLTHNHPMYWDEVLFSCKHLVPGLREMKVSQVHVAKRFIEEGLGCSILPRSAVRRELAEGRMLEAELPMLNLPLVSTYLITKSPSEETLAFEELVMKLV